MAFEFVFGVQPESGSHMLDDPHTKSTAGVLSGKMRRGWGVSNFLSFFGSLFPLRLEHTPSNFHPIQSTLSV